MEDRSGEAATLYGLARVERSRGRLTEALGHIEPALEIVESLRGKVISQELRASYFAAVQDYYELSMDVLMRLHGLSDLLLPVPTFGGDAGTARLRAVNRALEEEAAVIVFPAA